MVRELHVRNPPLETRASGEDVSFFLGLCEPKVSWCRAWLKDALELSPAVSANRAGADPVDDVPAFVDIECGAPIPTLVRVFCGPMGSE